MNQLVSDYMTVVTEFYCVNRYDITTSYQMLFQYVTSVETIQTLWNIYGDYAFDENVKNESSVKFQLTSMKSELKWKRAIWTAIVFIVQRMSVKVSFRRFTRSLSLFLSFSFAYTMLLFV
jgi:hypothetical protein